MKSKATLKQIAKELGVSVSTVSKALNGSPEISEPTKKRVQEYAKLKNYKPNVIGLSLKNRKTKTIGVIIPNILNHFFAKVFSGIEKVADEKLSYKIVGRREGDIEKIWANPDRANNVLGWKAQATLEETMESAWKWQLKLRERGIM